MFPSDIINRAKLLVHANIRTSSYSASDFVSMLNDGVECLVSECRNRYPLMGLDIVTITQTAGTETTDLPTLTDRVLRVRDPNTPDERLPVDIMSAMSSGFALTDSQLYWVHSDETNTWELWRTRQPWEVHYGEAAAVGATSITFATTPTGGVLWSGGSHWDDYYNGAKVYIRSATTYAGQTVTVTDYVGSTGVATVAWADGTPTGTVVYEIQPMIDPREFKSLLAWEVALRIQHTSRNEVLEFEKRHPYSRQYARFVSKWQRIQDRMGQPGRMIALDRQQ